MCAKLQTQAPPSEQVDTQDRARRRRGAWGWIDDRLGLSALTYPVPAHANTIWYTLGGITFMGLVFLVATGVWLSQYYNPDPAGARSSILYIQSTAPLGNVIRGVHVWLAYVVGIIAVLHLIRVFVTASYKVPREINWLVGIALLALVVFGEVFTGTILRWDQEAYEAMSHNMELAGFLGAAGGLFQDTFTTSVPMLGRLYNLHVSIFPLMLALLLIVHFFLIKHHGISPTPEQADSGIAPDGRLPAALESSRYSHHALKMLRYGLGLLVVAGILGLLFVQPVGPVPDPSREYTKPPFLFYWLYPFEDWFGVLGIAYAGALFFGLLAIVPFVDRSPWRGMRRRRVIVALGIVLLVAMVALSIMTAVQPATRHMG